MVASILNSSRAVQMSVNVVRAFVKLRQVLVSQAELARKPDALEASLVSLDSETRRQFEDVYAAVRALMASPQPSSRPIGLTADLKGQRSNQATKTQVLPTVRPRSLCV
jgi:hypothetical protein